MHNSGNMLKAIEFKWVNVWYVHYISKKLLFFVLFFFSLSFLGKSEDGDHLKLCFKKNNTIYGSIALLKYQRKESVKTDQQKLPNWNKREKKFEDKWNRTSFGKYKMSSIYVFIVLKEKEGQIEKQFLEIMPQILQIWWKRQTYRFKRLSELYTE